MFSKMLRRRWSKIRFTGNAKRRRIANAIGLRQLQIESLEARSLLTVTLFTDTTGNSTGNTDQLIGNFIKATKDEANDFDFIPRLGTSFYTFHNPAGATGDLNVRLAA